MDYVAELKRLWTDLDHYDPIDIPDSQHVPKIKKWIERRRAFQFLRGMFHQDTLPTLEEAIAAIAREEVRLKVMKDTTSPVSRPVFAATRIKEIRECFNCGNTDHFIRDCPLPLKSNRGRGRGNYRGVSRGGSGGHVGTNSYKANAAAREEELSQLVGFSSTELEERKHLKEKVESFEDKDQGVYSGDFVNFAYMDEGNYAHASIPTPTS
jgi:hypothetical protein